MNNVLINYLKYGLLWYITWVVICLLCWIIKFFNVGDFLVCAILGLFAIITTLVIFLGYELLKYIKGAR